jgi:FeS assembly SUF system protein
VPDDYRYPYSLVSLPVLTPSSLRMQTDTPEQVPLQETTAEAVHPAVTVTETPAPDATRFIEQKLIHGKVIEALRTVYDPEIPVNIYELGLIYDIKVLPDNAVEVKMTLTAPACPVAGSLPGQVEQTIEAIPEVKSATVELVWEPPWSRDLMSEAALLQLNMM